MLNTMVFLGMLTYYCNGFFNYPCNFSYDNDSYSYATNLYYFESDIYSLYKYNSPNVWSITSGIYDFYYTINITMPENCINESKELNVTLLRRHINNTGTYYNCFYNHTWINVYSDSGFPSEEYLIMA